MRAQGRLPHRQQVQQHLSHDLLLQGELGLKKGRQIIQTIFTGPLSCCRISSEHRGRPQRQGDIHRVFLSTDSPDLVL